MISPKKIVTYKEPKLLPTVNLTDQLTLNTWLDLRKLAVDYGRKYFYRHEIFLPVIFIIGMVSLVGLFVLLIIDIKASPHVLYELTKMMYLLGLNVWVMFYLFFGLLYQGAGINIEFVEHQKIMKKNKQLYNDLVFFKEFYLSEHYDGTNENIEVRNGAGWNLEPEKSTDSDLEFMEENEREKIKFERMKRRTKRRVTRQATSAMNNNDIIHKSHVDQVKKGTTMNQYADSKISKRILAFDYIKMRNKLSASFVHRKLAQEISECLGSYTEEFAGSYIRNIMEVNDACIEELEDLEKFESLNVLGFDMTYGNVNNFLIALISIGLTSYEIFST